VSGIKYKPCDRYGPGEMVVMVDFMRTPGNEDSLGMMQQLGMIGG
jgi:hypothetical protein